VNAADDFHFAPRTHVPAREDLRYIDFRTSGTSILMAALAAKSGVTQGGAVVVFDDSSREEGM
jgi:polysaccharide deacetylase 2 family uncharacterized protein YibQ